MQQQPQVHQRAAVLLDLPEGLLTIILRVLDQQDLARLETSCRALRRILSRPQIRGIWRSVVIHLDKLPDCRSCGRSQVESCVTARVLPLCVWLQARAFGIIDLQLSSSDCREEEALSGVALILAALHGYPLAVHVNLPCQRLCNNWQSFLISRPQRAHLTLLRPLFQQPHSIEHLVSLYLEQPVSDQDSLTKLAIDFCRQAEIHPELLGSLSQLRILRLKDAMEAKLRINAQKHQFGFAF
ncbi:hypothetical protein WJX73_008185 [Symbiochloris irregularis]|uniref:F-box domain-containing protein n=1 Tax=Symbiochloris irregularis TaxID=706552 RepID=A0AAW1PVI4_9CHLO